MNEHVCVGVFELWGGRELCLQPCSDHMLWYTQHDSVYVCAVNCGKVCGQNSCVVMSCEVNGCFSEINF